MPKPKEALASWLETLKTQGKLKTEELEAIQSALTPDKLSDEAVEAIGGSILRQEDYSRLANELKAKEKEVESFQAELSSWKGDAEKEYFDMQRKLREAEAERVRLEAIAKEYVPESELGKGAVVPEPKEKPQDLSEYMKAADAQEALMNAIKVQNRLLVLNSRHQTLFGKPLEDEDIIDRAIANKRTVDQEWEETYKVADKRAELAAAAQEAHDQKIREEERTKVFSELKLPEIRAGAPTSPVLDSFKPKAPDGTPEVSGLEAAVAAFTSGKYKPGQAA